MKDLITEEQIEKATAIVKIAQQSGGSIFHKQALTHALYDELILTEIKNLCKEIRNSNKITKSLIKLLKGDKSIRKPRRTKAQMEKDKKEDEEILQTEQED